VRVQGLPGNLKCYAVDVCQVGRGLCLWAICAALRLDPPCAYGFVGGDADATGNVAAPSPAPKRMRMSRPASGRFAAPVTSRPHPPTRGFRDSRVTHRLMRVDVDPARLAGTLALHRSAALEGGQPVRRLIAQELLSLSHSPTTPAKGTRRAPAMRVIPPARGVLWSAAA